MVTEHGLGRLPAPDDRDERFLMAQVVPAVVERTWRYWWPSGWWGDQGATPQCVGYAWTHWLEDGPVTHDVVAPIVRPDDIYHAAQRVDEWPGEDYAGTSVRAGAKVLQELGLVGNYLWAWDVDTVVRALLDTGPLVFGSWWYSSMFTPEPGTARIEVEGARAGGHAYVLNGVNVDRGIVRIKNSWGRSWGNNGYAYMDLEDLGRLLGEGGEACLAVEVETT